MRFALPAMTVSAAALAIPAQAADIQISSAGPVVELTVSDTAKSKPDAIQVNAGVQVRAPTASEAIRLNAQQMEKVIAQLKALGVSRDDIQTSNFSLNAQYQYRNDGEQPTFVGYDVSNTVTVTLRKMDRVGETLDALVKAGANNVNGPMLLLENDKSAKASARKSAFESARAQAMDYARMSGFSNIRLLEISETYGQFSPPAPMGEAVAVTARSKDAVTPVETGLVGTTATVTVKYEMTN